MFDIVEDKETCRYLLTVNDNIKQYSLEILILILILLHCIDPEKNLYYWRPVAKTIYVGWFAARFCISSRLCYQVEPITLYFLAWQWMYLSSRWEYRKMPLFSVTVYRASLCVMMAFDAFFIYDIIIRYLSVHLKLAFFWIISVVDM